MPAVNENTMTDSNNEIVTDFFDSVGTSSVTYTYTSTQTELFVRNESERTITVTINATPTAINAWSETTISAEFTSFSIVATGGHAGFYVRSVRGVDTTAIFSSQISTISGSATTPAIAPVGDANTGIFFPATDTIAFGEGGTEVMRINSSGNVGIGTNDPNVSGLNISRATGSSAPTPAELRLSTTTSASDWSTTNPWGRISFYSADASGGGAKIQAAVDVVPINSAGGQARLDLSVHDSADLVPAISILAIAAAGTPANVGIGTTSPSAEFHVKGTGEITRIETTTARGSGNAFLAFYDPDGSKSIVGHSTTTDEFRIINAMNANMQFYTNGTGRLMIEAGGTTRPSSNNTFDLGSSTYRWATIYAQNALNTSDARLKTNVEPSSLGLDFIASLNPVQYRWIEGGNTVEKVQIGTETVEITPAQPEVLDEEGNVIQEAVPAVTEEKPIYEEKVTAREGVRTHFGLIAQEVKAAIPAGIDFAGWCLADKDDANSTQSLGYTQLISPMIKAIQELKAEVDALKSQLASK